MLLSSTVASTQRDIIFKPESEPLEEFNKAGLLQFFQ
jgi:hypothetical protein